MNILVTGGTGFVGSALAKTLRDHGHQVRCVVRQLSDRRRADDDNNVVSVGNIDSMTDWRWALNGQSIVVHTAGRAHIMKDKAENNLEAFLKVNTQGTLRLARQAADAGVQRFVFISSIKVNGEQTSIDQPFTEDSLSNPCDPYSHSKLEAEEGIQQIGEETGMEFTIIRPTMVYGPGVKGNLRTVMHWLRLGMFLPLRNIHNLRSIIALDNLISLIEASVQNSNAANQVFLAGDGVDVSTPELFCRIGRAMDRPARLFPFPRSLLELGGAAIGKRAVVQRLCSSLRVDIGKARSLLNWSPPVKMQDELQKTVDRYIDDLRKGTHDTDI